MYLVVASFYTAAVVELIPGSNGREGEGEGREFFQYCFFFNLERGNITVERHAHALVFPIPAR